MDADSSTIVVGPREAVHRTTLTASEVNWVAGTTPARAMRVRAQIRHRHPEAAATVSPEGETRVRVEFDDPQPAISPGQAVVFYDDDVVVGGGWID